MTPSSTSLGISSIDNRTQWGLVAAVSNVCENYSVGNLVMFDPTKSRSLMYGSTTYLLIDEENISGSEVLVP